LRLALRSLAAAFWGWQLYSGSARFGETNSYSLFRRSRTVFAFPNVVHFFAHKFACLGRRRFAFALVLACTLNYFFFCHNKIVSPREGCVDVTKKAAGVAPHRSFASTQPILSSALLTAALLTATLFFTLAPLTFTLLSVAILLRPSVIIPISFWQHHANF
jgi:hypothetical protein